jgi:glutamate dehydrogenase
VSKKQHRRSSDITDRLVDDVVASRPKSSLLSERKQINLFLRTYFSNVAFEDMQGRSPKIMAQAALSHLEFAKNKSKGQALVRIFNPTVKLNGYDSAYTIIEMVNDDMPFLVDSVAAAINRQSLNIHITVHPVLRLHRTGKGRLRKIGSLKDQGGRVESFVRFVIDKETDEHKLKIIEHEIRKVLADVAAAVRDWRAIRIKMHEAKESLVLGPIGADEELRKESMDLLQWMSDDHFTFLGYREYALTTRGKKQYLRPVKGTGLGVLSLDERGGRTIEMSREMQRLTRTKDWLIITKANSRATVHRRSYLDYIGVKKYDDKGNAIGEMRFIGLFTSIAYSENPRNIPLLRLKVQRVLERSGLDQGGHRGKALFHILDSFPRDELFQSSIHDLLRTTNGVLNIQERHTVRFFVRRDTFRRFFSCLVYVPREKYTTSVRRRIEKILLDAFGGTSVDTSVQISDSLLARAHIIVRTPVGERPRISFRRIEDDIAEAVVTWRDKLSLCLSERFGVEEGHVLFRKYGECFPPAYESDMEPSVACLDVKRMDGLLQGEHDDSLLLHRPRCAAEHQLNFRTFQCDDPLLLSSTLPILEDLGVEVHSERPYEIKLGDGRLFWIQDFELRSPDAATLDFDAAAVRFQDCFHQLITGGAEKDGFNRLILAAELDWRETSLIRCYGKYLQQLRLSFSQDYMEDVLVAHSDFAKALVEQFELQFDPALARKKRERALRACKSRIEKGIEKSRNLDEDRILSAFSRAISATLRTNYYQRDAAGKYKAVISIKLDPSQLPEVPLPRPRFEIFVYAPEVEGVHLRGGEVARGGIRWSDRREDFRTEVLGLMKAQVVKNTVIVPTGAKGGFIPKRLPTDDRDLILQEGIACYRKFISGLLDITDNVIDGKVIPPADTVRRDGDDPYLVVAADKGTATFSDIANALAADYNFWLDDAFASGGSVGYDHKKMGITARGAWEAVKRHFREQGINVQTDPFTVAGIGDMAGDVFGNGMLLSRKIKLVAAFNHEFIFLDPNPDMAASFRERKRLFQLPRPRWSDYDDRRISKGGGLFSRHAKQISLSAEIRELLDLSQHKVQPLQLIQAILKMQVDLLWNGGIGTYVKASAESHADVGDRSNDNVRVNGNQLRCKVIGEGGNLGLTQLGRIEYSLNGGRVNTDFIDNSAGVDCSDREVNIKILLGEAERQNRLTRSKRNTVLVEMTDQVAEFVLRNNYLQTQAISMMEARAVERLDETARLITNLEKTGLLDRDIEFLPDEAEIDDRRQRKQGLTRPEISVVLSYAKIDLYDGLTGSTAELEDFLTTDPQRYFPPVLRRRYKDLIPGHRLSREILATLIANNIVNRMGPAYVQRMQHDTGADVVAIARAYVVAREVCQARHIWKIIESLDNEIPATLQQNMMFEVSRIMRHACFWLLDRYGDELDIVTAVEHLKEPLKIIYSRANSVVVGSGKERHLGAIDELSTLGVPDLLAKKMAGLLLTRGSLDIADLAVTYKKDVLQAAKMYALLSERLGVVWLHHAVENLQVDGRWQAMARGNLRDEFYAYRRDLATKFLCRRSRLSPVDLFHKWVEQRASSIGKYDTVLREMKLREELDFATLSVAAQELRKLIAD